MGSAAARHAAGGGSIELRLVELGHPECHRDLERSSVVQRHRDLLRREGRPRASRPRGLLILSMGEGVRHLVPQSAKEAHSRRGEATKGLEEKRNDVHVTLDHWSLQTIDSVDYWLYTMTVYY